MQKLRNKIQKFMYNKYGADELGNALVITALVLSLIASLTRIMWLSLIAWVILVWELFRMFSKNYVKRRLENDRYRSCIAIITRRFKVTKNNITDKSNRYYLCPNCHQMIRIPRGKGKITITCPTCRKEFDKKS